jgi:CheY-like chemotaxis protein
VPQPLVLAIEPDLRQAAIVKRIVREKVLADVAVVDSRDAALEAMRTTIPDVLLLSALMSPRDEDELIAHLRTLEHADHLQTHTIPQLASALGPTESRGPRGLLAAFRRKKEPEASPSGCDPDLFAEEIRTFLRQAAEKKRERSNATPGTAPTDTAWRTAQHHKPAAPVTGIEPVAEAETASSSWSSPFEWKPTSPQVPYPESSIADPESLVAESMMAAPVLVAAPLDVAAVEHDPARVAQSIPAADPVLSEPLHVAEAIHVPEAILAAGPVHDSAQVHDSVIHDSRMHSAESGMRDSRLVIKDRKLGPLASWARSENRGRDAAQGSDDLRSLLTGLAVPPAVVSVGYGRGCRIRRVRVPAAREPQEAETVGAVILSKRLLAEQRERPEPRA